MHGGSDDRDLLTTFTAAFDLRDDRDDEGRRRVVPYLLANAGLLTHWSRFGSSLRARSGTVLSFGGGARIALTETMFIAPEYRMGMEPQMRFMVSIGWRRAP
jgi:hypothetical protein